MSNIRSCPRTWSSDLSLSVKKSEKPELHVFYRVARVSHFRESTRARLAERRSEPIIAVSVSYKQYKRSRVLAT